MKKLLPFLAAGAALLSDQISKSYAGQSVILNTGVSFGLFSSGILTIVLVIVLIVIAVKFGKQFMATSAIASGLFFGASLSNILDRVMYGGVRDFLPVPILGVRNNLADWIIILSLGWILFKMQQKAPRTSSS